MDHLTHGRRRGRAAHERIADARSADKDRKGPHLVRRLRKKKMRCT